jgi:MFS family permease
VVLLLSLGLTTNFFVALLLLTVWGVVAAIGGPVSQAYVNDLIPSKQRATVLSFNSLMGNVGGVAIQPALGRTADLAGYGFSLVVSGAISAVALPFLYLSRRQNAPADAATAEAPVVPDDAPAPTPEPPRS